MSQQLENICVSLELAKQLKEAGYPQESLFYWWEDTYGIEKNAHLHDKEPHNPKGGWTIFSAPTASEIGEELPKGCSYYPGNDFNWCCHYQQGNPKDHLHPFLVHLEYADTEANARAKMWLYLKKEELL